MGTLHNEMKHRAFKRAVSVGTEDCLPENQELLNMVKKEVADERRKSMMLGAEEDQDGDGDLRMESLKEVKEETEMDSGEAAKDGSGELRAASPVGGLGSGENESSREAEGSGEEKSVGGPLSGAAKTDVRSSVTGALKKEADIGSSLRDGDASNPNVKEDVAPENAGKPKSFEPITGRKLEFSLEFMGELAIWKTQVEEEEKGRGKAPLDADQKRHQFYQAVKDLLEAEELLKKALSEKESAEKTAAEEYAIRKRREFFELVKKVAGEGPGTSAGILKEEVVGRDSDPEVTLKRKKFFERVAKLVAGEQGSSDGTTQEQQDAKEETRSEHSDDS
ncbi:hypothetical protein CAEBREN_31731 [Caenorhabditis brenneri]|uniref:Uncharacterized protein n=1 Tax=Caenorhabditis brenneri TaxID=135651 RepID=G0NDP3_CAEBE|nr:hypothetical protein CAEBREN_31731 [Caenorhabditis brenneri]